MSIALFTHIHLLPKVTHDIDTLFAAKWLPLKSFPLPVTKKIWGFLWGHWPLHIGSDGDTGHFTLVET